MILTTLRSRKRSRSNRDAFPHQKPITVTKGVDRGEVGRWGGGGFPCTHDWLSPRELQQVRWRDSTPKRIEHPSADPTFEKSQSQLRRRSGGVTACGYQRRHEEPEERRRRRLHGFTSLDFKISKEEKRCADKQTIITTREREAQPKEWN